MNSKTISDERLKNICKINQGANCCRYISCSKDGFECEKNSAMKNIIDSNINNMVAKGDNCKGL